MVIFVISQQDENRHAMLTDPIIGPKDLRRKSHFRLLLGAVGRDFRFACLLDAVVDGQRSGLQRLVVALGVRRRGALHPEVVLALLGSRCPVLDAGGRCPAAGLATSPVVATADEDDGDDEADGDEAGDDGQRDDDEQVLTDDDRPTPVGAGARHRDVDHRAVDGDRHGREGGHRRLAAVHRHDDQVERHAVALRQVAVHLDDAELAVHVEQAGTGSGNGPGTVGVARGDVGELERDARVDAAVGVARAHPRDDVAAVRARRHEVGGVRSRHKVGGVHRRRRMAVERRRIVVLVAHVDYDVSR